MPSFDVVSEVDKQEVRNAVDQAQRELATRFDFKGTNSSIEAQRPRAHPAVVQRGPPAGGAPGARGEAREAGRVAEGARVRQGRGGAGGTVRQTAKLNVGISSDKARELNKFIKELGSRASRARPRATSCG